MKINYRINQLLGFASLAVVISLALYAFFLEYNDRAIKGISHTPKERPVTPRKFPDNIPLYEFELSRRGIYQIPYYKLKQADLTDNNNKWTFLFIGTINNVLSRNNPSAHRRYHESQGRFLNKIYSWIDHDKTRVVYVNATPPDGPALGPGGFAKGCGSKCYDLHLFGGVDSSVDNSFYKTTQKWLAEVAFGDQYQHVTITSLPIVIIIDNNNIVREVMPSSYSAMFAYEYYERLAQLQSSKANPVYSENYLNRKQSDYKYPNYLDWVYNKIMGDK